MARTYTVTEWYTLDDKALYYVLLADGEVFEYANDGEMFIYDDPRQAYRAIYSQYTEGRTIEDFEPCGLFDGKITEEVIEQWANASWWR